MCFHLEYFIDIYLYINLSEIFQHLEILDVSLDICKLKRKKPTSSSGEIPLKFIRNKSQWQNNYG